MSAWRTASMVSQKVTLGSGASSSGSAVRFGSATRIRSCPPRASCAGDHDRRALPQIVDIRLIGQAEAGDDRPFEPLGALADLRDDKVRLRVVDLARGADQPRAFRRGRDDEPRIDGDAVPADARTAAAGSITRGWRLASSMTCQTLRPS